MRKRTIGSLVIALLIVLPAFWFSGFNFDTRGAQAGACYFLTLFIFGAAFTCPAWNWHD